MVPVFFLAGLVLFDMELAYALPTPTANQLRAMDYGLAMFQHFSVDPWSDIEHNCVGSNPECIPASAFNPTALSTDQWVETAVAFGASEICLTAHHEGGFCLWDTKWTNYSVMHSPYGKDVVKQFVQSCNKYGVKPCYYMGPNSNGWLTNNQSYSAERFVEAQLGMLRELLTNYGTDYVSRLWWDHYPDGCGGLAPCPEGSFPDAWPRFVSLVRELSPSTIICPGPDCDGHQGESGLAQYPSWFNCNPQYANGTELQCGAHAPNASLSGFHPYEACATMHNGWFCKGDGEGAENVYWSASDIWDHYVASVGVGWINTLNAPPGTTGQIPQRLVTEMVSFGTALKKLMQPIVEPLASASGACDNGTLVEITLPRSVFSFNALVSREDLTWGQRITSYALDYFDGTDWHAFPSAVPPFPPTPPTPPPMGCSPIMPGVNLVYDAGPGTQVIGRTDNASACQQLCVADATCNAFTWHDQNQTGGTARACYDRTDNTYSPVLESGHFSALCSHSKQLGTKLTRASGAAALVHGQSVGGLMIDFVDAPSAAEKLRFRCISAVAEPVFLKQFSVHFGERPS